MDEAGKHFTGELSMTTYYVANRYHSKTKCYLIPDEMKNCKNVLKHATIKTKNRRQKNMQNEEVLKYVCD